MKKTLLIFLLFVIMLIFAEEKIPDNRIKYQPDKKISKSYEMIEKLPYSGISSTVTLLSEGQRGYYNIALGFAQIRDFKSALKYAKKIEKQRVG